MLGEMPTSEDASEVEPWAISRVYYPAGVYRHPPSGLVQVRVVRRGSSYADIDLGTGAKRVFTRPGDLLVSLPDRPTAFTIEEGRELTLLQLDRHLVTRILAQIGGRIEEYESLLQRPTREPLAAELCRRLEASDDEGPASRAWAIGLVLSSLLRQARSRGKRPRGATLEGVRLQSVMKIIDEHLDAPLAVDELARAAGLSRKAFSMAFRDVNALPVHQYVLRRRAERAVELLKTTNMPLAEVAQRSGFAHQAHMNRVVLRLVGKTPGKLRSASAQDGSPDGVDA